tara:strand:+ start:434 stop:1330 length:897 start_codon:yes stop_codon:yes gene_type:complete
MKENLLIAKNVTKQFENYTALDKVNISVPKGSVYGLLGPNGAGKTTLMRIINQITAPDSGKVFFNNEQLQKKHICDIGYMPEERGLYKKMKVGEQALYLAQLKGMSYNEALEKLKIWFKKLNILSWWNKKIEELSKGMAQKIQFIVTIIHQPKLLIFDEPFSGFDPINAAIIRKEIETLSKEGATIIFSTHRMESVEEICDHIALINKSKTILEGPIKKIKKDFSSNYFKVKIENNTLESNKLFEIINQEQGEFRVLLKQNVSGKEFLNYINSNYELTSFKKESPTMEEIFIKAVNNA